MSKMKSSENEILNKLLEIYKNLPEKVHLDDTSESSNPTEVEVDKNQVIFLFLKEELERRNITQLNQLPLKQKYEIIELANILPVNDLLFKTVQKLGLTEKVPFPRAGNIFAKCQNNNPFKEPIPYLTGTCFQLSHDQCLPESSIFDLSDISYPSVIGYSLPQKFKCNRIGKIYNTFKIFPNWTNYVQYRNRELKSPFVSIKDACFWKGEPKVGYNISHKKQYGDIAFTFVREFRQFSLTLTDKLELSDEFVRKLKDVISYTMDDYFGIKQWEDFLAEFGTHVVHSSNGGGRIVITVLENNLKNYLGTDELIKKESQIEQLLCNLLEFEEFENTSSKNPIETLLISSIRLEGGDPSFQSLDLTNCKTTKEMRQLIKEWTETLKHDFIMLDTFVSVVPIAQKLCEYNMKSEAEAFDEATKKILGKSYYASEASNKSRWSFW